MSDFENEDNRVSRTEKTTLDKLKQVEIKGGKVLDTLRERYYLLWGLILGFLLGTFGDFLATHWIEMLRAIVVGELWFTINLFAFLSALAGMLVLVFWAVHLIRELQRDHRSVETLLSTVEKNQKERLQSKP